MTVRDVLSGLHPTRSVVIVDLEDLPIEEGIAGGLLDESDNLNLPAVYCENDFPYLIVAGVKL